MLSRVEYEKFYNRGVSDVAVRIFTLHGYIYAPFLTVETAIVTSCLLTCTPVPFWKGVLMHNSSEV